MEEKRKPWFRRKMVSMITALPSFIRFANYCYLVFKQDAYLAKQNVITLICLVFFMGLLFISSWFCILGILLSYLISLHLSWLTSLAIILILNLLLLMVIVIKILLVKNKLFANTRELVRSVQDKE